ncbi:MAG: hypothetical protein R3318_05825, partial [Gammaproteobacteria bacterium]|nr:hypothetical protein [Gammaproteobacteria bacterium]
AGVLFYELLTNEKPYFANTPSALIYKHVHADLPKLKDDLAKYQPILDRLLAKDPGDRYQSAVELIRILEKAEKGIIEA